ncbi:MAG: EpsG family protein [Clostridia bacterium]|nr:EpsG family protein [Clostridia bacterium]
MAIVLLAMLGAKPQYRPLNGFAFIILFVFAAIRYDFGNDYMGYYEHFQVIKLTGESHFEKEWLYTALNELSPNFFFMVALMSLAFVIVLWRLVNKQVFPELVWAALAILLFNPYLFLMDLSAMRQTMALVMFIIAVGFANKQRIIFYCLLICAAMLFHSSAIILLPFYFWANDKKVSRVGSCVIAGVILLLLFSPTVIMDIIEQALTLFDSKNYEHYFSQGMQNSVRATLLTSISLIYILINLPELEGNALRNAKLWCIGISFNVLAYRISMLTRMEMYFTIFSIVAFPMMIKNSWKVAQRHSKLYNFINQWALPALIILVYALRYYSFFTNPMWEDFYQYQTIIGLSM